MMNVLFEAQVPESDVYGGELPEYDWQKYQKGFMGILNNAYNQSCNGGSSALGQVSEIATDFELRGGGSWQEFVSFYDDEYDGIDRRRDATIKMTDNIVERVESVGGSVDRFDAMHWAHQYVWYMLSNTYRGFCSEARAVELLGEAHDVRYTTAVPIEDERAGIDGYLDGYSVQVKPRTYTTQSVEAFAADLIIMYEYNDNVFEFEVLK